MATEDLSALKPVYIIYGVQDILLDQAVDRLKKMVASAGDLDFNFETFQAPGVAAADVIAAANTLPFLSERRLVVLHDLDKLDATAQAELAEYVQNPSPSTILVMTCEKPDKRTKLFKAAEKTGSVNEYKAEQREYPALVMKMFQRQGCEITRDGAVTLIDRVGGDLRTLSAEVAKVAAFVGPGCRLGRDEVEAVVRRTAPVTVFDMTDAIGRRDVESALRAAMALQVEGESALRLAIMGAWHIRNMIRMKALSDRGMSPNAAAGQAGMNPFAARKALEHSRHFTDAELLAALRSAANTEAEMKTSPVEEGLVLERWIATVCRATPSR